MSIVAAGCPESGFAAQLCANLDLNGFRDWFLPSRNELNEMFITIGSSEANNIGGFENGRNYWSSTEQDKDQARVIFYFSGQQFPGDKEGENLVRPIRAF